MGFLLSEELQAGPWAASQHERKWVQLDPRPTRRLHQSGSTGIRRNLDLPGGFSFQNQSNRSPRQPGSQASSDESLMNVHITVSEDGTLRFSEAEGNPLASHLEARIKDQQGAAIKELLVNGCKENEKFNGLESLHLATPPPHANLSYAPELSRTCARVSDEEGAELMGSFFSLGEMPYCPRKRSPSLGIP